jgi:adenylate cyclase
MSFSLQTRFLVFLLLPVTLILLGAGYASLNYARSALQEQWTSAVQLRLEKTAHQIQMRLDEKKELMELVAKAEGIPNGGITQTFLLQRLQDLPGVRFVDIEPVSGEKHTAATGSAPNRATCESRASEFVCLVYQNERTAYSKEDAHDGNGAKSRVNCPKLQTVCTGRNRPLVSDDVLSMVKNFGGTENAHTKRLVVSVRFESLLDHVLEIGKWTGGSARLVTRDGTYLARTDQTIAGGNRFGEPGNELEETVLKDMQEKDSGTVLSAGCPPETVVGFHRVPNTDWYLVLSTRGSVVFAPISRFHFNYLLAGLVTLSLVALLIRRNTLWVSGQIAEISLAAHRVEEGDFTEPLPVEGSDEIAALKRRFNLMVEGLRQKDLIEETFGRYVDKKIADELMRNPDLLRLGGENHVVTIMMADLRGFTQAAQTLSPDKVIKFLNRHFSQMISVIEKHEGIIVDFYGDSILAFFNGIESDVTTRAADAVKCALEMQSEAESLSEQCLKNGLPVLPMGIGIHTGEVVVGNIGSEKRAKYGIVGSAVNETDRIQALAEGGTIIVSGQTYELICDRAMTGEKCQVELKGLSGARDVYQVLAMDAGHHVSMATEDIGHFTRSSQ